MSKKNTGQRNFFRFMTLIGVVVIGGLGYSFIGAAPNLNDAEYHSGSPPAEKCMACHVQNIETAPSCRTGRWAPAPSATARSNNPRF